MSTYGLQHVVCRGAIDPEFLRQLALSPMDALRGFDLAEDESAMVAALRPQTLDELARGVEAWRRGDPVLTRVRPVVWPEAAAALAS